MHMTVAKGHSFQYLHNENIFQFSIFMRKINKISGPISNA